MPTSSTWRSKGRPRSPALGPDEFVIVRTGDDALPLVRRFARAILEIVAEAIPLDDLRLKLAASASASPRRTSTREIADQALRMADRRLQRARETGGNHIVEYDASLEESRRDRLALQADIRRGLDADEFDLDYQPIFDFGTQAMLGVEALLRWPRRAGGAMGPATSFPAAEASGLIEELGLFALRRACRGYRPLPRTQGSRSTSRPCSSAIPDAAARASMPSSPKPAFRPSRLQLEITESFLLAHPERAKRYHRGVCARAASPSRSTISAPAISSIGYLRQFSFDRVKLDRSLVDEHRPRSGEDGAGRIHHGLCLRHGPGGDRRRRRAARGSGGTRPPRLPRISGLSVLRAGDPRRARAA